MNSRAIHFLFLVLFSLASQLFAAPATDRMSPEQVNTFLDQLSEISRAVDEREYAVGEQNTLVFKSRSGSPSSVVQQLKFKIRAVSPSYVNISRMQDGTYNEWFSSYQTNSDRRNPGLIHPASFPLWTESALTSHISSPTNYFVISPEGGKNILESTAYGISPCLAALPALIHLPVKTVEQQNFAQSYYINTNQHYINRLFDEGRCITNSCTSKIDPEYDGTPVTYDCAIPSVEASDFNYTGNSVWEFSFSASHQLFISQNGDDYTCLYGYSYTWNRTRIEEESASVTLSRQFPTKIDLLCSNLKPNLNGTIKPYSRFLFSPRSAQIFTNNVITGCEDVYCNDYDDEGNITGEHFCGTVNVVVPRVYTVQEWQPGLAVTFLYIGQNTDKSIGQSSLLLTIPVPADPFNGMQPSLTHNENYSCNSTFSGSDFGLFCHGTLASSRHHESCSVSIPNLRLDYEVKPVLLEANFEYCR